MNFNLWQFSILPTLPKGVGRSFNTVKSNLINDVNLQDDFSFPSQTNLVPSTIKFRGKKKKEAIILTISGGQEKDDYSQIKSVDQNQFKSVCTADLRCQICITNQTSSFTFDMQISTFLFSFDFFCWYLQLVFLKI